MGHLFAKPRRASTLVILRESRGGSGHGSFEVLMLLRHRNNKFAPSRYVFPGGAADKEDEHSDITDRCRGMTAEKANRFIPGVNPPQTALASWVTAVRETFEESLLLFAYDSAGEPVSLEDENQAARFSEYRRKIYKKEITFNQMVIKENLSLATDRITYLAHWVTPVFSPIRYDTRFFIAKAPAGQTVQHDNRELIRQIWITPADALAQYAKGTFRMVLPTIMTLEELSAFKSIDEAISSKKNVSENL